MALASAPQVSIAAVSFGTFGINNTNQVLDFATTQAATEWSTLSVSGGGPNTITTAAQMDTAAQALTSLGITGALSDVTNYNASANFHRNSTDGRLFSSTSSGAANVLMATLTNNSGGTVTSFNAIYDFGIQAAGSDDLPGFFVYYSTTGLANSWIPLGQQSTAGQLTHAISPSGGVANGSSLYMVWIDDNSQAAEGVYTLDNFQVGNVVPEPISSELVSVALVSLGLRRRRR